MLWRANRLFWSEEIKHTDLLNFTVYETLKQILICLNLLSESKKLE